MPRHIQRYTSRYIFKQRYIRRYIFFFQIKNLLKNGELEHMQRIDVCPNDCIAYWDSKYLPVPYQHWHRDKCPVCDASRYVDDPADGARRPSKTIFFFPVAPFVRALYARPDLVPYLRTDAEDGRPNGAVTRSKGFKEKVLDNPLMGDDPRNLGLIGTADGVPYFKDQKRGCWPFILRVGNLPDSLSTHVANVHLHMLSANEFWEHDKAAGVLRRRVRAPKSLMPHFHVIVDDLLRAYHKGCSPL